MSLEVGASDHLSVFGRKLVLPSGMAVSEATPGGGDVSLVHGSTNPAAYDARLMWLGAALNRELVAADQSFGISVLSDSTANSQRSAPNAGDWPYELGALIAAAHPAWTVRWYLWNDTNQDYNAPVTIQTGTGGARSVRFPGTGFSYQMPSGVVASAPTNLDVAVLASLDSWTPAAVMSLAAHSNGAGNRGWWLNIQTNGRPSLTWSNDGTTLNTVTCSAAPTVANGASIWIRVTLQVNDGGGNRVIKFFTSPDGATWTQLGTTTTTVGTTVLFNPPSTVYNIGSRDGGNTELLTGNVFEIRHLAGIGPAQPAAAAVDAAHHTLLPVFADQWEPVSSTSPNGATGAPILSIVASAQLGQGLAYLSNATRLLNLLPDYSLKAVFMATSHNESTGSTDSVWAAAWASWITAVKARAYEATPVVAIENPQITGSSATAQLIRAHTMRRAKLLTLAGQLDVAALDSWQGFIDTGNVAAYIQTDGVHPSTIATVGATGGPQSAGASLAGSQVWANYAYKALNLA